MDSANPFGVSLLRWHVVVTKPLSEHSAKCNLERQGYRVYFPRLQKKILRRGTWRETISALFPRYLFVQLNTTLQSLAPVRSTFGVASVVRFGTDYVTVPETIINGLIEREDESGFHRLNGQSWRAGTAIRIVSGVFAGVEGFFEREDAEGRIVVLLNLLGVESRIRLANASIVAAHG